MILELTFWVQIAWNKWIYYYIIIIKWGYSVLGTAQTYYETENPYLRAPEAARARRRPFSFSSTTFNFDCRVNLAQACLYFVKAKSC